MNKIDKVLLLAGFLSVGTAAKVCAQEKIVNPPISYAGVPGNYRLAGLQVSGVEGYEDYVLTNISGLQVGQEIEIPGNAVTDAVKRYWKHGLFSDVSIAADSIVGNDVYLHIYLKTRPRVSTINYSGVKKSEQTDLENSLGLLKGGQITPNMIDRAKLIAKKYFDDKGYKNAEINIRQREDVVNKNHVILDIEIDKHEKLKVRTIYIHGNQQLPASKIKGGLFRKGAFAKIHEAGKLGNFLKAKKFTPERWAEDKKNLIAKYNELGYRDARILRDSVWNADEKHVNVYVEVDEGIKYYVRNITWVGNTVYSTDYLSALLGMHKGDVYNQKFLSKRLTEDDDAVGNAYWNNGYIFYNLEPAEVNVVGDSIDLEMRIYEGRQATINKVSINGNDRLYENVVRRELRTKPGDLFSKEALERSYREIAQMGHFNPENIQPDVQPDMTNGTVDINWNLESKANDQVEFSAGWGQTGVIGKLSLKFTNFSMANLFHKSDNYRGFLPQGDGQTLTISGQTNGSYYQSYSVSFFDPWFGGKRPNSFSVSAFYSIQTDISSNYYNSAYMNNYYNYYSGYGNYYGGYNNNYESFYDPDKSIQMYGASIGWGKRLRWPDDYFTLSAELSYQRFILKDWSYLYIKLNNGEYMSTGNCNNLSLNLTLARNSTDNPIFPRRGSEFSASVQLTPPYSLFSNKDYSVYGKDDYDEAASMFNWIEYHKWKFKSKTYTALTGGQKCPVIMTRAEFGLLGHYNKYNILYGW